MPGRRPSCRKTRRFCISALRRYTARDFIAAVDARGIAWHEKTLGQLFCDGSAMQIVTMLTDQMAQAGVELRLGAAVERVDREGEGFALTLSDGGRVGCASLVVASGGKSIPKMGATGWGYDIARQFGLRVTETRPALVPLTFEVGLLERWKPLAGVAVDAVVSCGKQRFAEAMLFTHRGLSGPAILQISSYWREGREIAVSMAPGQDVFTTLKAAKASNPRQAVHNALAALLPARLALKLAEDAGARGNLADAPDAVLRALDAAVNGWRVKPVGSEGYRTARGDPGRRRHAGPQLHHHGGQRRARPLFHRRMRRRHRLARRLQFPVGLVERLGGRAGGVGDTYLRYMITDCP